MVHQPEHLPWLGFYNRLSMVDAWVVLDTVQYRKRYFQNRNRILTRDGVRWVTVPVKQAGRFEQLIRDVEIETSRDWPGSWWNPMREAYRSHPHAAWAMRALEDGADVSTSSLAVLNVTLNLAIARAAGVTSPYGPWHAPELDVAAVERIYGVPVAGPTLTKGTLMLALAQAGGATEYVAGPHEAEYLDRRAFAEAGISLLVHRYEHPTYHQHGQTTFTSHLSVLDAMFNLGPDVGALVRTGGSLEALCAA